MRNQRGPIFEVPILRVETEQVLIDALAFSPDGKLLASTHSIGSQAIRVWRIDEQQHLRLQQTLLGHTEIVYQVLFSPDGTLLLSCSADGTIRFWDVRSAGGARDCIHTLRVDGPYAGMNITDRGASHFGGLHRRTRIIVRRNPQNVVRTPPTVSA